ncbi:hypothetical protein N9043_00360 [bacterium]|nr:hypothetical protein [bacterium]
MVEPADLDNYFRIFCIASGAGMASYILARLRGVISKILLVIAALLAVFIFVANSHPELDMSILNISEIKENSIFIFRATFKFFIDIIQNSGMVGVAAIVFGVWFGFRHKNKGDK